MSAQWYLTIDGERQGPFSTDDLMLMASSGTIDRETLLHNPEYPESVPAGQIKGLFPELHVTRAEGASVSSRKADWHTKPIRTVIPLILLAVVAVGAWMVGRDRSPREDTLDRGRFLKEVERLHQEAMPASALPISQEISTEFLIYENDPAVQIRCTMGDHFN